MAHFWNDTKNASRQDILKAAHADWIGVASVTHPAACAADVEAAAAALTRAVARYSNYPVAGKIFRRKLPVRVRRVARGSDLAVEMARTNHRTFRMHVLRFSAARWDDGRTLADKIDEIAANDGRRCAMKGLGLTSTGKRCERATRRLFKACTWPVLVRNTERAWESWSEGFDFIVAENQGRRGDLPQY